MSDKNKSVAKEAMKTFKADRDGQAERAQRELTGVAEVARLSPRRSV